MPMIVAVVTPGAMFMVLVAMVFVVMTVVMVLVRLASVPMPVRV